MYFTVYEMMNIKVNVLFNNTLNTILFSVIWHQIK